MSLPNLVYFDDVLVGEYFFQSDSMYTRVARFSLVQHTKNGKIYQITTNIPNSNKMYQMAVKQDITYEHITISSIARPFNIYPNLDFLFENIPSGNPVLHTRICMAGCLCRFPKTVQERENAKSKTKAGLPDCLLSNKKQLILSKSLWALESG
jgi:hypothetical protein